MDKVQLGKSTNGIFTHNDGGYKRRYKFRITSKHTGKILDLNVAFHVRQKQQVEDIVTCEVGNVGSLSGPETVQGVGSNPSSAQNKDTVAATVGPIGGIWPSGF